MTTPDYDSLRAEVRSIVDEVIRPNAERIDRESIFPRDNLRPRLGPGGTAFSHPSNWAASVWTTAPLPSLPRRLAGLARRPRSSTSCTLGRCRPFCSSATRTKRSAGCVRRAMA